MAKECKYYKQKRQVSYDNGVTWQDVVPAEYQKGDLYEMQSQDCGYVPPVTQYRWIKTSETTCIEGTPFNGKFKALYSDGRTNEVDCNDSGILTRDETHTSGYAHSAITSAYIGDCVTELGHLSLNTFVSCKRINSDVDGVYNIPSTVNTIGWGAFGENLSVTRINIPESVKNFDGTGSGPGIGRGNTFQFDINLTGITLPSSVETDNAYSMFYGCRSLKSVVMPTGLVYFGAAFIDCTSLTSVTLPNTAVDLHESFRNCTSLSAITIPDGVKYVTNTFFGCSSLKSIVLPASVTRLGYDTFSGCTSLSSITINALDPPMVYGDDDGECHAFDTGNFSTKIYVPCESLEKYRCAPFYNRIIDKIVGIPPCTEPPSKKLYAAFDIFYGGDTFILDCTSRSGITSSEINEADIITARIGDCVEYIDVAAFAYCTDLRDVIFNENVRYIYSYAFAECYSLNYVWMYRLRENITIYEYAFRNCENLREITLPPYISFIDSNIFYGCTRLESITISTPGDLDPPRITANSFDGNTATIYVPASALEKYRTATNWSNYASRIQPIS